MRRLVVIAVLFAGTLPAASAHARTGYAIPPDNPFVATPGARGEIYAYGLRNPWRWTFDSLTGDAYMTDVGAAKREELTFLSGAAFAGANFGWNCLEGTFRLRRCRPPNYFPPTHEFHSSADVIIGGYVVRDPALPSFAGRYLYGRYESGIYALRGRASGRAVRTKARVESLTSFGQDGLGRLYASSFNGPVYRLTESAGALALTRVGVFHRPVGVVAPPGDADRLFVVEKRGRVKLLAGGQETDFLNIMGRVHDSGYEEGLLGFAVAPDYASSGRVFAFYVNNAGHLQLDEYTRTAGNPDRADASTRRPLLTIRHGQSHVHNGGQLLFGPDGYLYLSTGDGDLQADSNRDAQKLSSLLGKILRLDVGAAAPQPQDVVGPVLRARVKLRQRVRAQQGAVVYVGCTESCSVRGAGRLRIAGRDYRMRSMGTAAGLGQRARLRIRLTARGTRALERALRRRQPVRTTITLSARDAVGNRSPRVVRTVRVKR